MMNLYAKKLAASLSCATIAISASACSSSSGGFAVPELDAIVSSVTPSGLSGAALVNLNAMDAVRSGPSIMGSCTISDEATAIACLKSTVLSDTKPSGGIGQWYRHWIQGLDTKVTELETRFTSKPDCFAATATDTTFDFTAAFETGSGVEAMVIPLQCTEALSAPSDSVADIAFGEKDDRIYVVNRTTNNTTEYIVTIASVDTAGTNARIMVLMSSADSTDIMRIYANTTTGAFAFNRVSNNSTNNDFNTIFARSDDETAMQLEAFTGGDESTAGTNRISSHSGCVLPSDAASAATGSCATIGTFPETDDLGPTTVFASPDLAADATARAAVQSTRDVDITALGALTTSD